MSKPDINILITGSNGQLGSEIRVLSDNYKDKYNFFFNSKDELDIANYKDIEAFVKENSISAIINCAAYTAVDKAEEEEELAFKINYKAVKNLAEISKEYNITLIHISTDYVFDGENDFAYKEADKTNPIGVYGKSKLAGEEVMITINPKHSIIIRTAWLFSEYRNNFLKTMLKLGREKDELNVVFDQIGSSTYAKDLADSILKIIPEIKNENVEIYHFSNIGIKSWYDFAKEIMNLAGIDCKINPIKTSQYPTPVRRPKYSLLNKDKFQSTFDIKIPHWRDSLTECLKNLGELKDAK